MLRFRLGPIPVEVHYSHLLFSLLFALWTHGAREATASAWPGPPLASPGHPHHLRTLLAYVLLWVGILFVTALVHELGHALVSRAFGYRPLIRLAWMGGDTRLDGSAREVEGPTSIPWFKDVLRTLAGPASGLLLGLLCGILWFTLRGRSAFASYALAACGAANLFWAGVNLIPVLPLDGGRVAHAVLGRLLGRRGPATAQGVSLLFMSLAIVLCLRAGNIPLAVMLGLLALRGLALASRESPLTVDPDDPDEQALADALRSYREGRLDDARRRCVALAEGDEVPRLVRSRAHHLLGWISLKEGRGRAALDHFSQVQEYPRIERQALAAAFSLIGDDARALPLWELAARETQDPTVLHEWAGALLRAGREELARRLPGVDLASAWACAGRVLFLREDYTGAARAGLAAFTARPTARGAYEAACALARAGEPARALELLEQAASLGFRDAGYASTDADLASLHGVPGFSAWLARLGESPIS